MTMGEQSVRAIIPKVMSYCVSPEEFPPQPPRKEAAPRPARVEPRKRRRGMGAVRRLRGEGFIVVLSLVGSAPTYSDSSVRNERARPLDQILVPRFGGMSCVSPYVPALTSQLRRNESGMPEIQESDLYANPNALCDNSYNSLLCNALQREFVVRFHCIRDDLA